MRELCARHGGTWRVYAPGRGSFTYVINHPDDVKRVLVGNHRNYTKGIGLDRVMMQPLFHRRAIGPDALSGCDLPAGADVLISPFLLHRHPGYRVARRFRLRRSTDEPIELEAQVNLRTRRPLMMRLERRA